MSIPGLESWLESAQGRYVLDWEGGRADAAVADVFGFNALQLGLPYHDFLRANRIPMRQKAGDSGPVDVLCEFTALPFAGFDPRKITVGKDTFVTDRRGDTIGQVLTCATDMAIDRVGAIIVSVATPPAAGRPADYRPRGLSCGFIKVNTPLTSGEVVMITDGRRQIRVEICQDIRPHRSARLPITSML
mgnify:CR=1 FL=1